MMKKTAKRLHSYALNCLNYFAPLRCLECDTRLHQNHAFCGECYSELPFQTNACQTCGQLIAAESDICGRCIHTPSPMDITFCPFNYAAAISNTIKRFKYGNHPEYGSRLAQLLIYELLTVGIEPPELLLPVPMHPERLRKRGYNQSALLCQFIAKRLKLPYRLDAIRKTINTAPQMELKLRERQSNVRGSFTLDKQIGASHIAIIDDVLTTGATASEIATLLKKNGAKRVQVWTIAHTA